MRIAVCHACDQWRDIFSQSIRVLGCIRNNHFADACNRCGRFCCFAAIMSGDKCVNIAANSLGCGDSVQRRCIYRTIIMFDNNKNAHHITFASFFSLSTSSATDPTLMPADRAAGSSTFTTFSRGVVSMPSSFALRLSIGFFLAFMIFGRDA